MQPSHVGGVGVWHVRRNKPVSFEKKLVLLATARDMSVADYTGDLVSASYMQEVVQQPEDRLPICFLIYYRRSFCSRIKRNHEGI